MNEVKTIEETLPVGVIAIITLKKPIEDQEGKTISQLTIKEPTASDYINFGDPYRIVDGAIESNPRVGLKYLEQCTGIHAPMLKTMHMHDMMRAVGALSNFFGQA